MKKIFILAIILLSGTAAASAQEFLTINPDVRTAGMANASVATTGGAYSVFQNAASSLFSHNLFEVGFSYSPWMRDVKKGYDLMAFGGFYSFNHKSSYRSAPFLPGAEAQSGRRGLPFHSQRRE